MSERHLMFCNLIAWKEGDEYVFEDGSKAYPYPDNDKRFDKFMLIPDWVVEGLKDTPFNYFGFKNGKIHVKQLGVFTREEFEREIVKYKYEELDKYIGKTIRLEDGSEFVLESYDGYKFRSNKPSVGKLRDAWIHLKDVVNNRNVLCSFGTELVASNGETYKRVSIKESRYKESRKCTVIIDGEEKLIEPLTLGSKCTYDGNIYPIISGYMYSGRVLYFAGIRKCRVLDSVHRYTSSAKGAGLFLVEFLDNGEVRKVSCSKIFNFTNKCPDIIKGKWVDAKLIDIFFDKSQRKEYYLLEFCDGSRTSVHCKDMNTGRFCHRDVFDAWRSAKDVTIKSYTYKNGKWIVESNIGTFERSDFVKESLNFQRFKENYLGKTLSTKDGYTYTVEGNKISANRVTYLYIRFNNGATKLCTALEAFRGDVLCNCPEGVNKYRKQGEFIRKYSDWSDSIIGLKFRVLDKKTGAYRVELENGDITFASRKGIKNGTIRPSFMSPLASGAYIGKYDSRFIVSIYFDFKRDIYVLLSSDGDILQVSRDGELKKTIKHNEA